MSDVDTLLRANYKIISNENETVFTNAVDFAKIKSDQGQYYIAVVSAVTIVISGFLTLQITNPANSRKTMYIDSVFGGFTGSATVGVLRNATFAAAGTTVTPRNANWSFGDSSSMTAKYLSQLTDPTSGGTLLSANSIASGPFSINYGGRLIVPGTSSDRQLYLRVTNAAVANTVSVNVAWWEL